MIYAEVIQEDCSCFRLERLRYDKETKWHSVTLIVDDDIWDNEIWIWEDVFPAVMKGYKRAKRHIEWLDKGDYKDLKRILKTADKLGWFNYLK